MTEKMKLTSLDVAQQRREELKAMFPGVFTETENDKGELVESIDFEKLKAELGTFTDTFESRRERYGFEWPGKKDCLKLIQNPSVGTLAPNREQSVDFDQTENLYVEGDNLEVLKVLQKAYYGKVRLIYIDPPYNTGNDFIYPDDYTETLETYLAYAGFADSKGRKFSTNTSSEGRYHTRWLNMMYPRIYLARNLMREDGAIMVSINDAEVCSLKAILNDIFGEENFVSQIVWQRSKRGDAKLVANVHEYILVYTKNRQAAIDSGKWRQTKEGVDEVLAYYRGLRKKHSDDHETIREKMMAWYRSLEDDDPRKSHKHYNYSDERGLYFADNFAGPDDGRKNRPRHDIFHPITGNPCKKPSTGWRWDKSKTDWALSQNPPRIHFGPDETTIPNRKSYLEEINTEPFSSVFYADGRSATLEVEELVGKSVFPFPKNKEVLMKLISLVCEDDDLVLDFFAGSGSTAHATLQLKFDDMLNVRFLLVQLPEPCDDDSVAKQKGFDNISDIAKTRLRKAIAQYKKDNRELFDSQQGGNTGFKVFELRPSNFRPWNAEAVAGNPQEIGRQLELHIDHVDVNATQEDILYELLIRAGFLPTQHVEVISLAESQVFSIADGALLICLEDEVTRELVDGVAEAEPMQFICLDKAFKGNDQLKANAVQTFAARNQGRDKAEQIIFRTV